MTSTQPASAQPAFTLRSLLGEPSQPPALADSTVVVIDVQQEYGPEGLLPLPALNPALDNIATILGAARTAGSSIVHIAHVGDEGAAFDPAGGGRFLDPAIPEDDEQVVTKKLPNAFAHTTLHEHLQATGASQLVLVGFMTHMCVSSTARGALDLGYKTTVVGDASATRALPTVDGQTLPADAVHQAALSALADRFSAVVATNDFR